MVLVLLMGVAGVSAGDNEGTIQATDESGDAVSVSNDTLTDTGSNELSTSQTDSLGVTNEGKSYGSSDSDVLTAADGTFTDLYNKVKDGGTVTLDRNYVYTASTDSAYVNGITLNDTITINGNGYTLDGKNAARMFQVTGNNVILNNINFINGYAARLGGAIHNNGALTIRNSHFYNINSPGTAGWDDGGAIRSTGTLNIYDTEFRKCTSWFGGAIQTSTTTAVLYLENCNFIENKGTNGDGSGALFLRGSSTIINCKFINNTAVSDGGAITTRPGTVLNIQNSEFINNSAGTRGGAISSQNGATSIEISGCYFDNNNAPSGKAVYNTVSNAKISDCEFAVNSASEYNSQIQSTQSIQISGSTLLYYTLYVKNMGTGNGLSRSSPTNWNNAMNNIAHDGQIILLQDTYTTIINQTILNDVSIIGEGNVIIDAQRKGRMFQIDSGINVLLKNIVFSNGFTPYLGGAILNFGILTIENCKFLNMYSNGTGRWDDGGAIRSTGKLYIYDSLFDKCTSWYGGAIQTSSSSAELYLENCNFTNNIGYRDINTDGSGALFLQGPTTAVKCNFINNSGNYGGAITCRPGTILDLVDCTFENNTATQGAGGAIYNVGTNLTVENSIFTGNEAKTSGGAIYNNRENTIIDNCEFEGNSAPTNNDITTTVEIQITDLTFNSDLTINVNDVIVGESLTITGTLSAAKAGAVIDIKDKGTKIDTVTVNNNQFTYTLATPSLGTHTISLATTDDSGNTYVYNTNSFSFRAVPADSYSALQILINRATAASTLTLARTYSYNSAYDTALVGGVKVNKSLTIKGAGYSIDGKNAARAFEVSANSVTIENTKFINGKSTANGGAIYWTETGGKIDSSTFESNTASSGNNLYATNKVTVTNSNFKNDFSLTKTGNINYGTNEVIGGTFASNAPTTMYAYLNGENKGSGAVSSNKFSISLSLIPVGTYAITLKDENSNTYTFTDNSFTVNRLSTVYISPSETGSGNSATSPTTWDKVADIITSTGTVVFAGGTYSDFYGKTINQGWTLQAASGATPVLDANNKGRIFTVSANNVKINGLTFKNAKVNDSYGSAIHWTGTGGTLTNSVLTANTGRPVSATTTLTMTNNQLKDQISLTKSNINWGSTENITGTFAHNEPSTVNILFNGTSQGSYSVSSGKVTASYAFTNPSTRSVGSYVVTDLKNIYKEVL